VMSAIGFLTAPLAFDFVRSHPVRLEAADWPNVNHLIAEMENEGRARLAAAIGEAEITFRRTADMRYRKQGFDISVPIPEGKLGPESLPGIMAAFERVYARLYGHTIPDTPIDVMSWRVVASGPKPDLKLPKGGSGDRDAQKGRRLIHLPDEGLIDVPVYDRYRLGTGDQLDGPVIVEERESTVVINGPGRICVDRHRNLIVDLELPS
ncbi:MAG: hydantoinase/oxoprolinase family protein, partial [Pseudomonadota bacterium]